MKPSTLYGPVRTDGTAGPDRADPATPVAASYGLVETRR